MLLPRVKMLRLSVFFFFFCFCSLTRSNSIHTPRVVFTKKETAVKRLSLPDEPIHTVLDERTGTVISVGQTRLYMSDFTNHKQTPVEVRWKPESHGYKITLVHQRHDKLLFLCGTDGVKSTCCNVNLTTPSGLCVLSESETQIGSSINYFTTKEGEHAVLVESGQSADLYVTHSGAQGTAGIHKFGNKRVRPVNHDKEQHYVGLAMSRGTKEDLQDKVYAFYKQRNKETTMFSPMWLPFVSQVCMADIGGPKNKLQFSWTSQLNARLFCGDRDSKVHFSELVDAVTVTASRWEDTKVYALFRNEWGMSAVCVYTMGDIDRIFTTSPFKEDNWMIRGRKCVFDSTQISSENLMNIEKASEMEHPVEPGSFFHLHHNYTHMKVNPSRHSGTSNYTVMFLSLNNGRIHKVLHSKRDFFIIAEYQPFNHRAHIHSVIIPPSSRALYVSSSSEVVQLDVANCTQYGKTCEDCYLSRDPDCSWNGNICTSTPRDPHRDIFSGKDTICRDTKSEKVSSDEEIVKVDPMSKHFLQCPMSSLHAQYTWHGPNNSTHCRSREEQCLFLIDSMRSDQAGLYRCVSKEGDYDKVVVQYRLQLSSRAAGPTLSPTDWVYLIAVLMIAIWW